MLKHLRIFSFLTSVLTLTSCAVAVIGIGAVAVGTVTYKNGNLVKTYQAEYNEAVQASSDSLTDFELPLTNKLSDGLKAVIKAERPDGTPIEITVVRISHNITKIGVRTGAVGVWDKGVSEQIHNSIGQKLSSGFQTSLRDANTSDRKKINSMNKKTKASSKVGSIKGSDDTSVSETPIDVPADNEIQKVVRKPPKREPDYIIYFSENTNDLSEVAVEKLNSIAEVIITRAVKEVLVNGFSDSNGTPSFNKLISESRANSVKIYLIGKGINSKIITPKGFGSDRPIADNKDEDGRRLNRRVEIELTY
jgi:outer membrane protein OmpA-like peptidoglycan-associated protein